MIAPPNSSFWGEGPGYRPVYGAESEQCVQANVTPSRPLPTFTTSKPSRKHARREARRGAALLPYAEG
jgi:hypothetical protein